METSAPKTHFSVPTDALERGLVNSGYYEDNIQLMVFITTRGLAVAF